MNLRFPRSPGSGSTRWMSFAVGHAIDDLHRLGRLAAAAHRDVLECRIGGDDEIRHRVAAPFEKQQRPIEEALVPVFGHEQFGSDIMLIEDESLAQELERRRGQKNEVRRIAGLNDRKAALPMNLEEQAELMKKRCSVF